MERLVVYLLGAYSEYKQIKGQLYLHFIFPVTDFCYFIFRTISTEQGNNLAKKWKASFLESSAKENKVCIYYLSKIKYKAFIKCITMMFQNIFEIVLMFFTFAQAVQGVFHAMIDEIEKLQNGGNQPKGGGCSIS